MEKTYYKAVLLVLASESLLYNELKNLYVKYIQSSTDIKVYFVYAGKVTFVPQDYDLVYENLVESVIQPHPAKKVVQALQHIDSKHTYDYLVRTNISTFWVFDKLLSRLSTLPRLNTITGRIGYFSPKYVVGSDMVISKNLIDQLLAQPEKVYLTHNGRYLPEDRILSEFFTETCNADILDGINSVKYLENVTIDSFKDELDNVSAAVDHFRVKNSVNRNIDILIHKELLARYYPNLKVQ
jgi:hypothetical protein